MDKTNHNYVYVMALNYKVKGQSDLLGFKHIFVTATDDEAAYRAGHKVFLKAPKGAEFANDYVIALT